MSQPTDPPDAVKDQSSADEQPFECSGLSTQGKADTDLVSALRDCVGKDAIDSDNRDCQRHRSGYPQQNKRGHAGHRYRNICRTFRQRQGIYGARPIAASVAL